MAKNIVHFTHFIVVVVVVAAAVVVIGVVVIAVVGVVNGCVDLLVSKSVVC